MPRSRTRHVSPPSPPWHRLAAALCCTLPCLAQVPLTGTWRAATLTTETFSSVCSPVAPVHAVLEDATAMLQPGGSLTITQTEYNVCPGGLCSQSPEVGASNYFVLPSGVAVFDDQPLLPGQDVGLAFVRANASMFTFGRWNDNDDEPYVGLAVRLSAGQGVGSLSGDYGFVRHVLRNDVAGQTMRTDFGTLSFDAMGGFTETSERHAVTWGGGATASTPFVGSDSYLVDAAGRVTIGSGGSGAVTADHEFVFWLRHACPEVELLMAVRKPLSTAATYAAGEWRIVSTEVDVAASTLDSDWGTVALSPTSPTGGTLDPTLLHVSTLTNAFGTVTTTSMPVADTYTVGAPGRVTLYAAGAQRPPVPAWISRDGSLLLGAVAQPAGAATSPGGGMMLGMFRGDLPIAIGAGTPGSGGIAPQLLPIGGFPFAGNSQFGVVVATGLGGAPALLLVAGGVLPAPLPFAGVDLWIDPSLFGASLLAVLSGPGAVPGVGAAGVPLTLPPNPTLAGTVLGLQALVLDPAGAAGLSASGALAVVLGR